MEETEIMDDAKEIVSSNATELVHIETRRYGGIMYIITISSSSMGFWHFEGKQTLGPNIN